MTKLSNPRRKNRALVLCGRAGTLARCESGATAIEYGLIASLLALAVITAMTAFGTGLTATYESVLRVAQRITLDP